ncbi:MAG: SidA/IucD/PvdA family monooxygenase, partial [Actinomycetota bacterium]
GPVDARAVVVASGAQSVPRLPALAGALPPGVRSLHTADYRSPGELGPGAVLVVGAGQSGCQIAEDLLEAGRRVLLATSRVGRIPRRYRGRDILEWWRDCGFLDQRAGDVDESARTATQPQVSGTRGGHTVSLQQLARDGCTLLGRVAGVDGDRMALAEDLAENMAFADAAAARHRRLVDDYVARAGIDAPPPEDDPVDAPLDAPIAPTRELDLRRTGVGTVIWSTGFGPDAAWLPPGALAPSGAPRGGGLEAAPGVYVVGAPWLTRRASGILAGFGGDARAVADAIHRRLTA